jgi:hypothetical protein
VTVAQTNKHECYSVQNQQKQKINCVR